MFTKTHKWRRWSGTRDVITEAMELSSQEIATWNNFPSSVELRIAYSDDLTETSDEVSVLANLSETDLHRVKSLWIDVKADRDLWRQHRSNYTAAIGEWRYRERRGDTLDSTQMPKSPNNLIPGISVLIRLTSDSFSGVTIEVSGPERTKVAGLMTRLQEVFNHAAVGPTWWSSRYRGFEAAFLGGLVGFCVCGVGYLAIVGGAIVPIPVLAIGSTALALLSPAVQWALPGFELLESGERSKFQRFRWGLISIFSTLVIGLITNAISARIHKG